MNLHPVLGIAHGVTALALFSLALVSVWISVLIAVKPDTDQARTILMKRANMVGMIENIMVAGVALSGISLVLTSDRSFSELWLWMSLLVLAFYSAALIFITKPARLAVTKGGSAVKVGMQVTLQIGHILLLIVAFAFMILKPV